MGPTRPLWLVFLGRDKDPAWDPEVFVKEEDALGRAAELGLGKRNVQVFATIRQVPQPMHRGWLEYVLRFHWMIPKAQLKDGAWYIGACRNAVLAQWDAARGGFVYIRRKWGARYPETILHPEDDVGWDVFWPTTLAHDGPVVPDIRGQGIGNGVGRAEDGPREMARRKGEA